MFFTEQAAVNAAVKNISVGKKPNSSNSSFVEPVGLHQWKDSGDVAFFNAQAAVNSTVDERAMLRGVELARGSGDVERSIWAFHQSTEERKVPRVESALVKIYLDTFLGLRASRYKQNLARVDRARAFKIAAPAKVEVSQTTLFQFNQNYDAQTFVASPELVSYWLDGVNSVRSEARKAPIYVTNLADFEYYASELVRSLDTVIANFAKLKAYDGGRYHMTFGGKILSTIETLIVDELLIPPSFTSSFVRELHGLLVSQTEMRPRFSGRWGTLILDDRRELIFDLVRRTRRTIAQVLKG